MEQKSVVDSDDWWKVCDFVDDLNKRRIEELYTGMFMHWMTQYHPWSQGM